MTWILVVALLVLVVQQVLHSRELNRVLEQHAHERSLLLDRIQAPGTVSTPLPPSEIPGPMYVPIDNDDEWRKAVNADEGR